MFWLRFIRVLFSIQFCPFETVFLEEWMLDVSVYIDFGLKFIVFPLSAKEV